MSSSLPFEFSTTAELAKVDDEAFSFNIEPPPPLQAFRNGDGKKKKKKKKKKSNNVNDDGAALLPPPRRRRVKVVAINGSGSSRNSGPSPPAPAAAVSVKRSQPRARARMLEEIFMGDFSAGRLKRDLRASRGADPHKSRRICEHSPSPLLIPPPSLSRKLKLKHHSNNTQEAESEQGKPFHFDLDAESLTNAFSLLGVKEKPPADKVAAAPIPPAVVDEWGIPKWPPPNTSATDDWSMHSTQDGVMMRTGKDLFKHQRLARDDMRSLEVKPHRGAKGKICAPEMGLGKTCITLSMVVADKDGPPGWYSGGAVRAAEASAPTIACFRTHATLVVCPLSMIATWVGEVRKFHGSHLRVMVFRKEYLGDELWETMQAEELLKADIVITSYETVVTVANDLNMVNRSSPAAVAAGAAAAETKSRKPKKLAPLSAGPHRRLLHERRWEGRSLLLQVEWERIVADESQRLSNPASLLYEAMSYLQSRYRQCLTGTPYSNYDADLWAQFCWMGYAGTARKRDWSESRSRAHDMKRCILIMNYKSAGITLPPITDHQELVSLAGDELCFYRLLFCIGWSQLKSTHQKKKTHVLVILNYLRQTCIAPYMLAPRATEVLLGKMDAGTKGKIDKCAGDANMRAFSTDDESSPLLITLGQTCSRPRLVGTMQHVLRTHYPDNVGGNTGEAAERRLAQLERWIVDINGTAGIQSAKNQKLVQVISHLVTGGHKILVFSAFTKALRLLRLALVAYGVIASADRNVAWLTGSVNTLEARDEQLRRFRELPDCNIIMMTYRVGSTGLNLTEGTAAVFVETKWNDVDRDQGMHRVWRIGQTKPVSGWDVSVVNSVEENMQNICQKKRAQGERMVGSAMPCANSSTSPSAMDLETIMMMDESNGGSKEAAALLSSW